MGKSTHLSGFAPLEAILLNPDLFNMKDNWTAYAQM